MDSVPHVPLQTAEHHWDIVAARHLTCTELDRVKPIALFEFEGVLVVLLALTLLALMECMLQGVEVDLGVRKDAELLAASRIKNSLAQEVVLERKSRQGCLYESLAFDIVNRNCEVRGASNNKQEVAVATEGHGNAAECGLHVELGNHLLAGHLVDVALWLQTVLTGSDQVVVGRGRNHGIPVLARTPRRLDLSAYCM